MYKRQQQEAGTAIQNRCEGVDRRVAEDGGRFTHCGHLGIGCPRLSDLPRGILESSYATGGRTRRSREPRMCRENSGILKNKSTIAQNRCLTEND